MKRTFRTVSAIGSTLLLGAALASCGADSAAPGAGSGSGSGSGGDRPLIGIITKTDSAIYFVKMRDEAQKVAEANGMDFQAYAGKDLADNESQVQAMESLISAGAQGILITPADSTAIVPSIDKARAAGIQVIALDTETDPADAVSATIATDNYEAGRLVGEWARNRFEAEGKTARIGFLDFNANQVTTDVQRNQGFLEGFGIDLADPDRIGDETDPRISGHALSFAEEARGRTAMEDLLQADATINLVYTINESAAVGAIEAIKAAGLQDQITLVSIDGSCQGVTSMQAGELAATSMQFPSQMGQQGAEALVAFIQDGTEPSNPADQSFTDAGTQLITDTPVDGLPSEDSAFAEENCF